MGKFRIIEVLKRQAFLGIAGLVFFAATAVFLILVLRSVLLDAGEKRELLRNWQNGFYSEVYEKSRDQLAEEPMDMFFLTMHGFASYQMAVSQIKNTGALEYINECIWSLRKVLLEKNIDQDGRLRYVLGKAYYAKGPFYADMAVKYLEAAKSVSFDAGDLNEYLGLAYVAVKDYRKGVEALSASLDPQDGANSDLLLLSIAQSYMGLEDWDSARAYLIRCAERSKDEGIVLKSRFLLGKVLYSLGNTEEAIATLNSVLETGGEDAEVAYELGEIFASQGDATRARAAFRRARRADASYLPAAARLNTM
ncbi:MAG: tetratricopeptide repeat protein [Spirochaetaceae bacterium]|jgi:tetratricopeptide (TPR) repeat protein|nr:tetratricopeptide repeat protein [Spirochaetaceae bacterium]